MDSWNLCVCGGDDMVKLMMIQPAAGSVDDVNHLHLFECGYVMTVIELLFLCNYVLM